VLYVCIYVATRHFEVLDVSIPGKAAMGDMDMMDTNENNFAITSKKKYDNLVLEGVRR
jgi:hypothetical protein